MARIAMIYLGRKGAGGPISLALGQALRARGASVTAFLSDALENLPAWQQAGLPFTALPTFHNSLEAAWTLLNGARLRHLAHQVRACKPELLLFPMFHPWNVRLQTLLSPLPSAVFVHDPRPHPGLTGWLHARREDRSLLSAAHCLVFSRGLAPELQARGVPAERIAVVPLGPLEYEGSGPPLSQPPHLLFFGRIEPYKGLEFLLEAFEQFQPRWPNVSLTVAGEGDLRPYQARLNRLRGVEVISGWIPENEIGRIFARATLLVLPYTSASQSGVLAIAAGFGLPVVATHTGGIPDQLRDGETGLLVEPGSANALVAGIERLLAAPNLARRLGAALRQDFSRRQNWDQAAALILQLCRRA